MEEHQQEINGLLLYSDTRSIYMFSHPAVFGSDGSEVFYCYSNVPIPVPVPVPSTRATRAKTRFATRTGLCDARLLNVIPATARQTTK